MPEIINKEIFEDCWGFKNLLRDIQRWKVTPQVLDDPWDIQYVSNDQQNKYQV